jgi:hypothetical protein
MVNCAPGFNRTPAVIDGCSDLLVELFGEAGRHTRAMVGRRSCPATSRSRSNSSRGSGERSDGGAVRGVRRLTDVGRPGRREASPGPVFRNDP